MSAEPAGMQCPAYSHPGRQIGTRQVMCQNQACRLLIWDSTKTMDELLDDLHFVDLTGLEGMP